MALPGKEHLRSEWKQYKISFRFLAIYVHTWITQGREKSNYLWPGFLQLFWSKKSGQQKAFKNFFFKLLIVKKKNKTDFSILTVTAFFQDCKLVRKDTANWKSKLAPWRMMGNVSFKQNQIEKHSCVQFY